MKQTLDIIIPTYRRLDAIPTVLESIYPQLDSSVSVLVVDHTPGMRERITALERQYPYCTFLWCGVRSLPAARNSGIVATTGDIVLFLDDDVRLHPGCIEAHRAAHASDMAAIVAGRVVQKETHGWAAIDIPSYIDPATGETEGNFDLDAAQESVYATGCNMSIKRSVFERIGLFDTRYAGHGLFEEVDFCLRARAWGYRVWYTPEAAVTHDNRDSGGGRTKQRIPALCDRLHNHVMFYFRHIHLCPTIRFFKSVRNLTEYICRSSHGGYNPGRFLMCMWRICRAYTQAYIPWWFPRLHSDGDTKHK